MFFEWICVGVLMVGVLIPFMRGKEGASWQSPQRESTGRSFPCASVMTKTELSQTDSLLFLLEFAADLESFFLHIRAVRMIFLSRLVPRPFPAGLLRPRTASKSCLYSSSELPLRNSLRQAWQPQLFPCYLFKPWTRHGGELKL